MHSLELHSSHLSIGAPHGILLLLIQCLITYGLLSWCWGNTCITDCPSISSKDFWASLWPMVIKTPPYELMLGILLSVSSVILTCYKWIVWYWAVDGDNTHNHNIRNRRIFRRDVNVILWIIWFFMFGGGFIICDFSMETTFHSWYYGEDIGKSYILWVRTKSP